MLFGRVGICSVSCSSLFFFNDTATTEIYTLSLHDALPISWGWRWWRDHRGEICLALVKSRAKKTTSRRAGIAPTEGEDRKSTRLNSSHLVISYAVFCLKKKTGTRRTPACPLAARRERRPRS